MTTDEIISLFKGVGIIIDENIGNKGSHDNINKIHKYLTNRNIPVMTYPSIPADEVIQHFRNVSFVVLDWNLHNQRIIPPLLIDENIHFIEEINKICFIPIFIFTNEPPHDIELILTGRGLYHEERKNNIFVKSKSEIRSGRILFSTIAAWVKNLPSIYVLKKWDDNTHIATSKLFHDMNKISPEWVSIMMQTYTEDVGTENAEIGNLLFNNLITTCAPLILDKNIISKRRKNISKEELRQILEREKYIKSDLLLPYPALGDIFKDNKNYYFNFRADCDIVREDNPELYLVKGKILKESELNKRNTRYTFYKGTFLDRVDFSIVPFINGGNIIMFEFKKLRCVFWKDIENKRIGRLIPPYSIRLKSQLMNFLQRQALPSIPDKAIKG